MPVIIPKDLPATEILEREYIPVMHEERANTQDIRPLHIGLLNLMPRKIVTETQFLRLIGNTPLQLDVDLIMPTNHVSKNTSHDHLLKFYHPFSAIRDRRYDGFIITGAPVEMMPFEQVDYWEELEQIFDFCNTNVYSTLFICWASQAALYYYYDIPKFTLEEKLFGVFPHRLIRDRDITRGFDDVFYAPHSRHTANRDADIAGCGDLKILASSDQAGPLLTSTVDQRQYFISGHLEYDPTTLREEYERDVKKGLDNVPFPYNYFPGDDPTLEPIVTWRSTANLLFSNWMNHIVYPGTPYDLKRLEPRRAWKKDPDQE
jgi:homoserine O-succinyltransferase